MAEYTPTERTYGHGSITLTHYPSSGRVGVVQRGTNAVMDEYELMQFLRESGLLAAHDEQVRAEQREIDLEMHHAYRPEVVAEVAVYLGDDADWDGIAAWCGGDIETGRDVNDEYYSWIVIPGFGPVHQGQWLVKHHDGSWSVRAEVEAPSEQSLATLRAEGERVAAERIAEAARHPHKGPHDTDASMLREAAKRLDGGYEAGGSNTRQTVARVLRVVADLIGEAEDA